MRSLFPPQQLKSHLAHRERLIWWDRPKQGLRLRKVDALLVPFSLLWSGFAFYWHATAMQGGPLILKLWGIPFVLIGIYVVAGRFFHDAWRRRGIVYGLTDKRVLIVTSTECISIALDGLVAVKLREHRDGEGSIVLAPEPKSSRKGFRTTWIGVPPVPTLERIPDASRVLTAIRAAQKRLARAGQRHAAATKT
jgi:hypothetical protein